MTLYTITNGLDIDTIKTKLWKVIIIQQNSMEKTLETYLIVTPEDKDLLVFVSEDKSTMELLAELLGIRGLTRVEEVKPEVVEQYGSQLNAHDILSLGRLVVDDRILPDDSTLWYH